MGRFAPVIVPHHIGCHQLRHHTPKGVRGGCSTPAINMAALAECYLRFATDRIEFVLRP